MVKVFAFVKMNLLILMKNKLSFAWSIMLPTIIFFINRDNITSVNDIVYWLVFIIINIFLYGVGLQALEEKDSGVLSIIFSINWIPFEYFTGLLLTQIIYSIVVTAIFGLVPMAILGFNYGVLLLLSLLTIIVSIPIAFLSYNVTFLKSLHSKTVTSILNIISFLFFITLGIDSPINIINPYIVIGRQVNTIMQGKIDIVYLLVSILIIMLSLPSIIYFRPLSKEGR
ncbi:hypothetical protein B8A42_01895 [Dolosigranulum pigrum]|jgi:hypothetical protein|uniref:Uncharacterized protein n=1 Tax=Dolosigranulum pigrum TaxID=29394 RepID=A0A328KI48_9LACT|nr:hypothetical protein [Dolosigranulum pigrum]QDO90966.1 hypothetical protein FNV33_02455 [Dolosigranulum pigrum]RAN55491.1 hypothetical protein B8A42_01895 [Dolosigranulum pigrum]VTU55556.1 hypothetical protein AMBR_FBHANALA_00204 [Dolosigranulum pigrum]